MRRTYFFIFKGLRGPEFTLYYDDPPSVITLRGLRPVLHKWNITDTPYANMSLSAIVEEFERRYKAGKLPVENMADPPAKKEETTGRAAVGFREKRWTVGDLSL